MNVIFQVLSKLTVLPLALISTGFVGLAAAQSMTFEKGTTWVYEGRVEWQEGAEVRSRRLSSCAEITEVYRYPQARVAVVRGFPSGLSCYGNRPHPRSSLLILSRQGLFEIG